MAGTGGGVEGRFGTNPNLTTGGGMGDNPYAVFFGENKGVTVEDKDRYPHETFNLPKAYEGKNKYLERQIWWMMSQAEFFIDKLCPWEQTDALHVKWDIWKFNHTLADLEPEQGVPRFITQERESRSDSLVRRGLAFMIEHGFYKTAEGQEHYMMNLRQIVDAVQTTVYYGVLQALLNAKNHYKEAEMNKGYTMTQMEDVMRISRERWGIAQKTERGMYVLDARIKDDMAREQVVPNVWVFPPRMAIYLTMVPSAEVVYSQRGPQAAENLEKGPANMLTFRGSEVHEAHGIDVDFAGEPRDMLTRDRMIGSYFTMYDHIPVSDGSAQAPYSYHSDMRSIYIYDMNADKFKKITLMSALVNSDFDAWVRWCNGRRGMPSIGELAQRATNELNGGAEDLFFTRSKMSAKFFNRWVNGQLNGQDFARGDRIAPDGTGARPSGAKFKAMSLPDPKNMANTVIVKTHAHFTKNLKLVASADSKATKAVEDARAFVATALDSEANAKTKKAKLMFAEKTASAKAALLSAETGYAQSLERQSHIDYKAAGAQFESTGERLEAGTNVSRDDFSSATMAGFIAAGVRIPVAFILARPFQRYLASSAILAKGGKDLGITYHGHHDFQLTDDVIHKVHTGHYTFYSKTVIRNPNHFAIAEDVFCTGYRGGEGTTFFSPKGTEGLNIQEAVQTGDPGSRSIFSMVISGESHDANFQERVINPISITGKHIEADVDGVAGLTEKNTYPSAEFYREQYNMSFWDMGHEDDSRFEQEYEKVNRCCFQGRQQIYNWVKGDFSNEIMETGHWGSGGTYEGARAARTGRDVFLKRPEHEPAFL